MPSKARQAWAGFTAFVAEASRRRATEPAVPELERERGWAGVFVAVRREELWCRKCGDSGAWRPETRGGVVCMRCGSQKLVRAVDVLRSGEYRVEI